MSLKLKVLDISRPICQGLENALELAGKRETAQRFRQIQHERFGLSSSEWESPISYTMNSYGFQDNVGSLSGI
jgi:hypothetical protein